MHDMETLKCYTVGHSELGAEELLTLIKDQAIDLVVDVRAFPYLNHLPHFDRNRMDALLHKSGISYVWMGLMLGNLTASGRLDTVEREREITYQEGISKLMDLLPGRRVCLLSSEANWRISHRHTLIAQTLMRYGIEVCHIEQDGSITSAQQDLFHLEEN